MLEVQVHRQLKDVIRQQAEPWPHQLTMARLVARSLTTGRSALMQVNGQEQYRLSYLLPALSWPQPLILAVPERVQIQILEQDLPQLEAQGILTGTKPLRVGTAWPEAEWQGVLMVEPVLFLRDRLQGGQRFPENITVVFDQAQDLESWVQRALEVRITSQNWQAWRENVPARQANQVLELSVMLTHQVLTHPETAQRIPDDLTARLLTGLRLLAPKLAAWQALLAALTQGWTLWAKVQHATGHLILYCSPVEPDLCLSAKLWSRQPFVIIGEGLDPQKQASAFRQRLGLGELTCLQFAPQRSETEISLFIPEHFPTALGYTEPTASAFLIQSQPLLGKIILRSRGPVVIILEPVLMRRQLGTQLAAQFGSRVGVERLHYAENEILVCGWEFWQEHGELIYPPQALVICTLPFPNHPVAQARMQFLRQHRKDWFRDYLLPITWGHLRRATNPLRKAGGLVAILDSRITRRNYSQLLLDGLEPARRLGSLERFDY